MKERFLWEIKFATHVGAPVYDTVKVTATLAGVAIKRARKAMKVKYPDLERELKVVENAHIGTVWID